MPPKEAINSGGNERLILTRRDHLGPQHLSKWGHYCEQFSNHNHPPVPLHHSQLNESIKVYKNDLHTSKYTIWSWIPVSLFLQFRKVANIYFLVISVLTCMYFSPKNPTSMIGTFSAVLIFSILRDGYEDLQRHREDRLANKAPVRRLISTPTHIPNLRRRFSFFSSGPEYPPISMLPPESFLPTVQNTTWEDLRVGDILIIEKNEAVPADILLLTSSLVESGGIAYVDTVMLDGENSLKLKASPATMHSEIRSRSVAFERFLYDQSQNAHSTSNTNLIGLSTLSAIASIDFRCRVTPPTPDLADFAASVSFHNIMTPEEDIDPGTYIRNSWSDANTAARRDMVKPPVLVETDALILRGSVVRNVSWIIGVVMYAGTESKLALNAREPPNKMSTVQKTLNKLVIGMLSALIVFCVVMASLGMLWESSTVARGAWYLNAKHLSYTGSMDPTTGWDGVKDFHFSLKDFIIRILTFLVTFSHLIPISLYVSLELLRMYLSWDIETTERLFDPISKLKSKVKNSELVDELGHIDIVFSDKTGTLTCNIMHTVSILISEHNSRNLSFYGFDPSDHNGNTVPKNNGEALDESLPLLDEDENFISTGLSDSLINPLSREHDRLRTANVRMICALLALCSSVLPAIDDVGNHTETFEGSSPDEVALVQTAARGGVLLRDRKLDGDALLDIRTAPSEFCPEGVQLRIGTRTVHTLPFSSDVRRMSVVVEMSRAAAHVLFGSGLMGESKEEEDGSDLVRILIVKGADSIMKSLALDGVRHRASNRALKLCSKVSDFAKFGLRVLVVGAKLLEEKECNLLDEEIAAAHSLMDKDDRAKKVKDAFLKVERGIILRGLTAVEDKLQEGVGTTLALLNDARIKVCMLTGDMLETAVNIGKSCHLIKGRRTKMWSISIPSNLTSKNNFSSPEARDGVNKDNIDEEDKGNESDNDDDDNDDDGDINLLYTSDVQSQLPQHHLRTVYQAYNSNSSNIMPSSTLSKGNPASSEQDDHDMDSQFDIQTNHTHSYENQQQFSNKQKKKKNTMNNNVFSNLENHQDRNRASRSDRSLLARPTVSSVTSIGNFGVLDYAPANDIAKREPTIISPSVVLPSDIPSSNISVTLNKENAVADQDDVSPHSKISPASLISNRTALILDYILTELAQVLKEMKQTIANSNSRINHAANQQIPPHGGSSSAAQTPISRLGVNNRAADGNSFSTSRQPFCSDCDAPGSACVCMSHAEREKDDRPHLALVIEGAVLSAAMSDDRGKVLIYQLMLLADATIGCRLAPKDKALVVHLIKSPPCVTQKMIDSGVLLNDHRIKGGNGPGPKTTPTTANHADIDSVSEEVVFVPSSPISRDRNRAAYHAALPINSFNVGDPVGRGLMTLAIGDGANDVPMIQEAHIGVGVAGREGCQAVNSADFSVPVFRMLAPLLLDKGRQANRKIGAFIVYYFYKNCLLIGGDLIWAFFSGLSGQILFPEWLSTCYNALWTSWPVLFAYGLDIDFSFKMLLAMPGMYTTSKFEFLNEKKFAWGVLNGLLHGIATFLLIFIGIPDAIPDSSGRSYGLWTISVACFSSLILIGAMKMALSTITWGKLQAIVFFFSIFFYFICLAILQSYKVAKKFQWTILNTFALNFSAPRIVIAVFTIPFVCLLPDFFIKVVKQYFSPTLYERMLYLSRTDKNLILAVNCDVGESRFSEHELAAKAKNHKKLIADEAGRKTSQTLNDSPLNLADDSASAGAFNSSSCVIPIEASYPDNLQSNKGNEILSSSSEEGHEVDEEESAFARVHPSYWHLDLPVPFIVVPARIAALKRKKMKILGRNLNSNRGFGNNDALSSSQTAEKKKSVLGPHETHDGCYISTNLKSLSNKIDTFVGSEGRHSKALLDQNLTATMSELTGYGSVVEGRYGGIFIVPDSSFALQQQQSGVGDSFFGEMKFTTNSENNDNQIKKSNSFLLPLGEQRKENFGQKPHIIKNHENKPDGLIPIISNIFATPDVNNHQSNDLNSENVVENIDYKIPKPYNPTNRLSLSSSTPQVSDLASVVLPQPHHSTISQSNSMRDQNLMTSNGSRYSIPQPLVIGRDSPKSAKPLASKDWSDPDDVNQRSIYVDNNEKDEEDKFTLASGARKELIDEDDDDDHLATKYTSFEQQRLMKK